MDMWVEKITPHAPNTKQKISRHISKHFDHIARHLVGINKMPSHNDQSPGKSQNGINTNQTVINKSLLSLHQQ